MKWILRGLAALLTGGVVYLLVAHLSGAAFPTLGLPLGGDEGALRRLSLSFWEDIQFKDFDAAAQYHAPELQDSVDIPFLLQRVFLLKPELLDIMEAEVVMVDIDSSGNRARVRTRVKAKDLTRGKVEEKQMMLYFERADSQSPWTMKLEDSLRQDEAEDGKKH